MNLDFGTDLLTLVFEMNDSNLPALIDSTIRRETEKWMPYVNIQKVSVSSSDTDKDSNIIRISVTYIANSLGITDPQTVLINAGQSYLSS